ncbi:MAG: glycosyltransferase, partial [Candidatus Micrarchaeaceae archaeon]
DYGKNLVKTIENSGLKDRIKITGFTDRETFQAYLAICDFAVQLMTLSRGETSRTILDCMAHAKAVICNANGSFAEIPKDTVYMLEDNFTDDSLIEALETLYENSHKRFELGENAREYIKNNNSPELCAKLYFDSIESYYSKSHFNLNSLINSISKVDMPNEELLIQNIASNIALSCQTQNRLRQLFVDVSELQKTDAKTGIQRVTRSILKELIDNPPKGYKIEPVYATSEKEGYFYARQFTMTFLDCPKDTLEDEPIDFYSGDIFLGLDLQHHAVLFQEKFLKKLRDYGVKTYFVVHDLLPVQFPQFFPEGAYTLHSNWLQTICNFDGAICVSKSVAGDLKKWYELKGLKKLRKFKIGWNHNAADIDNSVPTKGMPESAKEVLRLLKSKMSFLMVGTIEPRKGHMQVIKAFEKLWSGGIDVNLIIVGKEGWMVNKLIQKIKTHSELTKRLFWLEGISDEYLEEVYKASSCLIMASEGEGFGLPLIEAAHHKLPIIARDIPVFREVAGEHAYYFENSLEPDTISKAILTWIELYKDGKHPRSDNMPYLTWKQSTQNLLEIIFNDKWEYIIKPS